MTAFQELHEILAKVDNGVPARDAALLSHKPRFDMLGGGRADAAAARVCRARRHLHRHRHAQTTEITGDGDKVNGRRFRHRGSGVQQAHRPGRRVRTPACRGC
ncbi:MAG: hypothetical protein ABIR94_16765 [Rubrivivax sp.]